ncbi:hypothetical protein [Enterococcus lemanii]|uniref:Secreted protein n=1 Tax=Enterococcus lemanii TaxID=1159752 RepID=A0ABV9MXC7_9ENTE|nr:hypothetical protein [Enterococcus lemanii]
MFKVGFWLITIWQSRIIPDLKNGENTTNKNKNERAARISKKVLSSNCIATSRQGCPPLFNQIRYSFLRVHSLLAINRKSEKKSNKGAFCVKF